MRCAPQNIGHLAGLVLCGNARDGQTDCQRRIVDGFKQSDELVGETRRLTAMPVEQVTRHHRGHSDRK